MSGNSAPNCLGSFELCSVCRDSALSYLLLQILLVAGVRLSDGLPLELPGLNLYLTPSGLENSQKVIKLFSLISVIKLCRDHAMTE